MCIFSVLETINIQNVFSTMYYFVMALDDYTVAFPSIRRYDPYLFSNLFPSQVINCNGSVNSMAYSSFFKNSPKHNKIKFWIALF